MSFITLFCIYSMIFFFIVLLKNMFSGGSNRKYKGMTEEEKEEYSKRISENSKRNFEEWEELKNRLIFGLRGCWKRKEKARSRAIEVFLCSICIIQIKSLCLRYKPKGNNYDGI